MEEICFAGNAATKSRRAQQRAAYVALKSRGGGLSAQDRSAPDDNAQKPDSPLSSESSTPTSSEDAIEGLDASEENQYPSPSPSQEPIELDSSANTSESDNHDDESSEGITFIEKNNAADTAKKTANQAKDTAKKIWKKLPKKWIAIGVGAIVVICIIWGAISAVLSQPLKLDASVTLDDVTISYPGEWELNEEDAATVGDYYSIDGPGAQVIFAQQKETFERLKTLDGLKKGFPIASVDTAGAKEETISGHRAYIAPVATNKNNEGNLLLVEMGSRVVVCITIASSNAPSNCSATLEAIIDSARIEELNESLTVTYMDGDAIVKEETVYNKGGGAAAIPPTDLTKEGYVLSGWELADESVNVDIAGSGASTKVQHITEDITLKAKWDKTWAVTFTDGNGNVLKTETVIEGKSATAPNTPTRDGFEFDGWSSELGPITGDTTINAKWKKEYESIPYSELARNPDASKGKKVEISGRVLQVTEGTGEYKLRVATNGRYDDVVMVGYSPSLVSSRILEDDHVTVYGTYVGIYSYTSVMGATISVPGISAKSIKVN